MTDEKKTTPEKEVEQPIKEAKPSDKKPEAPKEAKPKTEEKKEVELDRAFPDVKPGCVVKVHLEITDVNPKGEEKKRIQIFEGIVIARKHGKGINSTITVRKESGGIGVEKIFPLNLPTVKKIEIVKRWRTVRAKLGYLRDKHKRLREVEPGTKRSRKR
ncbi:50S ribosomal protein L19 [Candidatus Falkowbacteria bacterium]|jgi:large subunit ribosomal protein L19|nr:50S ribosomal protein L19 [Candidatus Falkowbacteria bacterium]MBT7007728.1 50S ribosomal protein L19 [Candidatus Falkowbacteria bacterium]